MCLLLNFLAESVKLGTVLRSVILAKHDDGSDNTEPINFFYVIYFASFAVHLILALDVLCFKRGQCPSAVVPLLDMRDSRSRFVVCSLCSYVGVDFPMPYRLLFILILRRMCSGLDGFCIPSIFLAFIHSAPLLDNAH